MNTESFPIHYQSRRCWRIGIKIATDFNNQDITHKEAYLQQQLQQEEINY